MEETRSDTSTLEAAGAEVAAGLDAASLLDVYGRMALCRALDERVWLLNRQGKAAIVASAQGHEAAQFGSVRALRPGVDHFYINYRDLGVLIALGVTPEELMRGYLARAGEPMSGARQFPTHGAYPEYRVVNLSNVVGTQIPQAVGAALASRMRGEESVTIVYFGDGGASVGDCHEAMNFAAIHRLPVIFFCENNRYAISVPLSKQMAAESIAARAEGYGMPGLIVDGCDVSAVFEAAREAAARAREGLGPTLIEADVERLMPHTTDDDDRRYRDAWELERARARDPLTLLRHQLLQLGALTPERDGELHAEARRAVNLATERAEEAGYPSTDGFHDHVYAPERLTGEMPSR